ncbi:hypothetical protein ACQEU3_40320 [Spirillospora sp. CA-253888]
MAVLLGDPCPSELMAHYIRTHEPTAVALNDSGRRQAAKHRLRLTSAETFADRYLRQSVPPLLLSNSSGAADRIKRHLPGTALARHTAVPDKADFPHTHDGRIRLINVLERLTPSADPTCRPFTAVLFFHAVERDIDLIVNALRRGIPSATIDTDDRKSL